MATTLKITTSAGDALAAQQAGSVALTVDPSTTNFGRQGNDLTITGNGGAKTVVGNFFVTGEGEMPEFVLPDGRVVAGKEFLAAVSPTLDLTTAAGPAADSAAAPGSGGEGAYTDGAGTLLDGVDRLGSLGTDQWNRGSLAAQMHEGGSTLTAVATGGAATPASVDPLAYIARGVLYTQNPGSLPTLAVDLLQYSGGMARKAVDAGATPVAVTLEFFDVQGLPLATAPVAYTYDPITGKITFTVVNPAEAVIYCLVTDGAGSSYPMQVVLTQTEAFDSVAHDAMGRLVDGHLAFGEWHAGKDMSQAGDYEVRSSELSDSLDFTGNLTGVRNGVAGNYIYKDFIDTGAGNDSLRIDGTVAKFAVSTGTGDDSLTVTGAVNDSRIVSGQGNDTVKVGGNVTASTVALGMNDSGVDTLNADGNTLEVAGLVTNGKIYGDAGMDNVTLGGMKDSTLQTGAGDDHVTTGSVTGTRGGSGTAAKPYTYTNTIDAGVGDDDVTVNGTISGTKLELGAGNDDLAVNATGAGVYRSDIDLGTGGDKVSITSAGGIGLSESRISGAADDIGDSYNITAKTVALSTSTLVAGGGDDTISVSGGTYGLYGASSIEAGAGNDSIDISGVQYGIFGAATAPAVVNLGTGADTLHISGEVGIRSGVVQADGDAQGDRITVSGILHGVMESTLTLGEGKDTLIIESTGSGSGIGVRNSVIDASAGNAGDIISISSVGYTGMAGSTLLADGGNNLITVSSEKYTGMAGSTINLGEGRDTVTVEAKTFKFGMDGGLIDGTADALGDTYNILSANAAMVHGAQIHAGNGDDAVTIKGGSGMGGYDDGDLGARVPTTVHLGAGADVVTVTATGKAGSAMSQSLIDGTADDKGDVYTISSALGTGMERGSEILAGGGDDTISVSGGSYGVHGSSIAAGAGDDNIHVKGSLYGIHISSLDAGAGDDTVSIEATAAGSTGARLTTFTLGDGHDNLSISGVGIGLHEVTVDAGTGNDTLTISGGAIQSHIDMGAGSDLVMLKGANPHYAAMNFDGGTGDDAVFHAASGDISHLGDILGFGDDPMRHMEDLFNFREGNTVKGFETLLVDFSNALSDHVGLDGLLANVDKLNAGDNEVGSVVVSGDAGDTFSFGAHQVVEGAKGVSVAGLDGATFDSYFVHDNNGDELQVYVNTVLHVG